MEGALELTANFSATAGFCSSFSSARDNEASGSSSIGDERAPSYCCPVHTLCSAASIRPLRPPKTSLASEAYRVTSLCWFRQSHRSLDGTLGPKRWRRHMGLGLRTPSPTFRGAAAARGLALGLGASEARRLGGSAPPSALTSPEAL